MASFIPDSQIPGADFQVWDNEEVWQYFATNMHEGDSLISVPEVESSPDPMIKGIKKVKRFACTVPGCGKDYPRNTGLRAHTKAKHEIVQKKFACSFSSCQSSFAENYELTRHLKKTHGVVPGPKKSLVYICPVEGCVSQFNHDKSLQRHIQKKHLNE